MKKFLPLFLTILICISCICPAFAATKPSDTVDPLWTNIDTADLSIHFNSSGTQGCVTTYVTAPSNTQSIITTVVVYERKLLSWTEVADYGSRTTTGKSSQSREMYFNATSGKKYKAEFTYTVNVNGVSETDSSTVTGTAP